jgi:hypothetical protein
VALWVVAVSPATLERLARLLQSNTLEVLHLCRRSVEALTRIWQ